MRIKIENHRTASECFEDFLLAKKGRGIADKTLDSYRNHFHAAGKIIDWNVPIGDIRQKDINVMIASLRLNYVLESPLARSFKATVTAK